MITFKVTAERFATALTVLEYLAIANGDLDTIIRVAPRFVVNAKGEYIAQIELDKEGDIKGYKKIGDAMLVMAKITPKRLRDEIAPKIMEAAEALVNPTSAGGSKKRSPQAPPELPDGS
jgi:hypothetical protein